MISARLKRSPTIARKVLWSTPDRSRCTTMTRSSPSGMRLTLSRKHSRSRRFMRFRATAPPTRLLTVSPRRVFAPGRRWVKRVKPFQETFSPRRRTSPNSLFPRMRSALEKRYVTPGSGHTLLGPTTLLGAFSPWRAAALGRAAPPSSSSDAGIRGSAFASRGVVDTSVSLTPPCPNR